MRFSVFVHNCAVQINHLLEKTLGIRVIRPAKEFMAYEKRISRAGSAWDYESHGYWVGGSLECPNVMNGYHGILKQWWEHYTEGTDCLLVSENNEVKASFQQSYPDWNFVTVDLFHLWGGETDIHADLCGDFGDDVHARFDLVICQATLEHVYDPFRAFLNMASFLKDNGVLAIHTHTPPFRYHAYPRDYFRFTLDWFEDIRSHVPDIELLELYAAEGNVFTLYKKVLRK
jgi:hypothetical protein